FLRSRVLDDAQGSGFSGVLCVGHRFEPGDVLASLSFLHRNVLKRVLRRRSVPVFFARRNPDGIARTDLTYRATPSLYTADARRHKKSLAKRMRMPGRACSGFEADPSRPDTRRIGCLNDGILPDRSGETRRPHPARGTRSASNNIHVVSPLSGAVSCV